MKKLVYIALFLPALAVFSFARPLKYGWITNTHIGAPKALEYLENVVNNINARPDIEFVIVSGDITETGISDEYDSAKSILDRLKVKYYVIPGYNDYKRDENCLTHFKELWGDDKFSFESGNIQFTGINSSVTREENSGHFSPEDLSWLDSELSKISPAKEVFFFSHYPLSPETDNWFEVTNRLRLKNIKATFAGYGHAGRVLNFNGLPAVTGRSSLADARNSWGYTLVENQQDSLFFFEIDKDSTPKLWGVINKLSPPAVAQIDSAKFINNGADILWTEDLKTAVSAPPLVWDNKIYSVSLNGIVTCFVADGRKLWEFNATGTITSRPVIADNILCVGNSRGDLFTLNPNTGSVIQTVGLDEKITSRLIVIKYQGDKFLLDGSKPDTVIIAGTASGRMICCDIHSLDQLWENTSAKGMIETKPLFFENKIIYGSRDGYLYCIDARSGILNWKWTAQKNSRCSYAACAPVTDGKYVYITTPDKFTTSIDILLGRTKWRKDNFPGYESTGISQDGTKLYIKGLTDDFFIVSASDGKILKKINMKFGTDTMPDIPLESNGNILFGAQNGYIYLIRPDYSFQPLIFTGTCRVLSVQQISNNTFAACNMDGKLFVFSVK
ncbi:MAG: PQQ-binding-like beta-propeller repeat protein [Ignavibacteria bacterium]